MSAATPLATPSAARRRRPQRVGSRLPRWLRPPRRLRPTRAGWIFFALTLGVGFGALSSGNNLLYLVFALMLAFLVLSGVLSESALRGIALARRLPREAFAESPATLAVRIRNTSRRFPAFAVAVEELAQPRPEIEQYVPVGRTFALRVGPGEVETRAYRVVPRRRGVLRLAGFRVSTRFPFGLFAKSLLLEQPDELLVYPSIDRHRLPPPGEHGAGDGDTRTRRSDSGSEVVQLRAFAPGDTLRRVHWRATLRRGTPIVRQTEEPRSAEAQVHLQTAGARPGDRFEDEVRRAASQVVRLLDGGVRVSLHTDGHLVPAATGPAQRRLLLAFLAQVEPDAAGPHPPPHAAEAVPLSEGIRP